MTAVEHEPFVTYDRSFAAVLGRTPSLVKVADVDAHEGPVWIDGSIYFTTVPTPTVSIYFTTVPTPTVSIQRLVLFGLAPGELRAPATTGGTPHTLAEGDVLAIPEGVPHQFTDVSDPFHYFVVKVGA